MSGSQLLLLGGTPQVVPDPNFEYTTLLLPGNGTNGAQNNTFLDSSTNAFSITRNGNTTQGTFSPFSQTGWGNYFDGSGDYLSLADNAAFTMGTGDFTVEMWLYGDTFSTAAISHVFGQRNSTATALSTSLNMFIQSGVLYAYAYSGSTGYNATSPISNSQWTHVAFVRDGSTLRLYVNGSQSGTSSISTNSVNDSANQFSIGRSGELTTNTYNGYISNFRLVKGTCVYPNGTTFTPPTTPLTAISGTSLLTCQSNRFIDNSTNNFTITRNGDVSVQAFSPFNPTAAWSAATNGGSGYFDGSGDYLTVASNAAFGYGTGDFTIEMWIYPTVISGLTPNIFDQRNAQPQVVPTIYINVGQLIYYTNGLNRITGATLVAGQWYHIAVCRASGSTRMFVNGVQSGSTYADANNYISSPISIFNQGTGGSVFQEGYCGDLRVVKGTALYTTTFTPPTAPLTAISGTSLLLNYTNAGIYDATSKNDLETVGNAQISTTQSKFGGSSMYFDGTGDWLTNPYSQNINFGTGSFTIEGWFRLSSFVNQYYVLGGTWTTGTSDEWLIQIENNGNIRFLTTAGTSFYSASITTNTWYHFAAVRNGSTVTMYINGSSVGSYSNSNSIGSSSKILYIGVQNGSTWPWNGFMQDLRITKGVARYTANFTAPTAAFPLL